MQRACIDIGSNTTRLLVAQCEDDVLRELHQERAFTRIGEDVRVDGAISADKIAEVVEVVLAQLRSARERGVTHVHGVATASIRNARNGTALIDAIAAASGLRVEVLSEEEEARLAFVGAARTLDHAPAGELGVVDVGGGSSELAVGAAPDRVRWTASFPVGSGVLTAAVIHSDPPSRAELERARGAVEVALARIVVPRPAEAVAVGGSTASLRSFVGTRLDRAAFERALGALVTDSSAELARRHRLDVRRLRLLPAGLVILQAVSERFGAPMQIGRGGVREGILLEASLGRGAR